MRLLRYVIPLLLQVILVLGAVALPADTYAQTMVVDLTLGGEGASGWSVADVKPGFTGSWSVTLRNTGNRAGVVYVWVSNIRSGEGRNPEPETGDTAEPGELTPYMVFDLTTTPSGRLSTNLTLPSTIDAFPRGPAEAGYLKLVRLNPGQSVTLNWDWAFLETGAPQNDAQGDTLSFDIHYTLVEIATAPRRSEMEIDPVCFFDVDMLGEVTRVYVTCDDGRCLANYETEDPDNVHFLDFTVGTRVTYVREGQFNPGPPRWVRMRESNIRYPVPQGAVMVSGVYTFTGYASTGLEVSEVVFDRDVAMELDYDPDSLPENTASVGIAAWDSAKNSWVIYPDSTDRVASVGTATADVRHFSTFVVLATTAEPGSEPTLPEESAPAQFLASELSIQPSVKTYWGPLAYVIRRGKEVVVSASIVNDGGRAGTYSAELLLNGKVIGTQSVPLSTGEQKQVRFHVADVARGSYSVTLAGLEGAFTSDRSINWWLIAVTLCVLLGTIYTVDRRLRRTRGNASHTATSA